MSHLVASGNPEFDLFTQEQIEEFKLVWKDSIKKTNRLFNIGIQDYYKALFPLNPNQIVPLQPKLEDILKRNLS